jgi:hypothetical protein
MTLFVLTGDTAAQQVATLALRPEMSLKNRDIQPMEGRVWPYDISDGPVLLDLISPAGNTQSIPLAVDSSGVFSHNHVFATAGTWKGNIRWVNPQNPPLQNLDSVSWQVSKRIPKIVVTMLDPRSKGVGDVVEIAGQAVADTMFGGSDTVQMKISVFAPPDTSQIDDSMIVNLDSNGRFQASYEIKMEGTHRVTAEFLQSHHGSATAVAGSSTNDYAIIIVGGERATLDGSLPFLYKQNRIVTNIYKRLRDRGFSDDDILLLTQTECIEGSLVSDGQSCNYVNEISDFLSGINDVSSKHLFVFIIGNVKEDPINPLNKYFLIYKNPNAQDLDVEFNLTNIALGTTPILAVTNGSSQSTTINTPFPANLQVRITDGLGNPLANKNVSFQAPPPSEASGSFSGNLNSVSRQTNTAGLTSPLNFAANSIAGSYTVTASYLVNTIEFDLYNTTTATPIIVKSSGSPQSTPITTDFATNLQVTLTDGAGNSFNDKQVKFIAPTSGASGTFSGSGNTVTVQPVGGVATAPVFTANNIEGTYTVLATTPGPDSLEISFNKLAEYFMNDVFTNYKRVTFLLEFDYGGLFLKQLASNINNDTNAKIITISGTNLSSVIEETTWNNPGTSFSELFMKKIVEANDIDFSFYNNVTLPQFTSQSPNLDDNDGNTPINLAGTPDGNFSNKGGPGNFNLGDGLHSIGEEIGNHIGAPHVEATVDNGETMTSPVGLLLSGQARIIASLDNPNNFPIESFTVDVYPPPYSGLPIITGVPLNFDSSSKAYVSNQLCLSSSGRYWFDFNVSYNDGVMERTHSLTVAKKRLKPNLPPGIIVTPPSHYFGEVEINSSRHKVFIIKNESTQTLQVSSTEMLGDSLSEFSIVSGGAPFLMEPGDNHAIKVGFTPDSIGYKADTLKIINSMPGKSPLLVALGGTGYERGPLVVDMTFCDFPDTKIGETSSKTITMGNIGREEVVVDTIRISGYDADDFSIVSGGGTFTLLPGESWKIVVNFHPASTGEKSGTIKLINKTGDQDQIDVILHGEGTSQ